MKRDGYKSNTKKMDSPLVDQRPCSLCPGAIEGADPHRQCIECLGSDHTAANLGPLAVCSTCRQIPRPSRHQRLTQFEDCYVSPVEGPELDVVEMEDLEQGVLCVFAIPAPDGSERQRGTLMRTPRRPRSPVTTRKAISKAGLHDRTFRR